MDCRRYCRLQIGTAIELFGSTSLTQIGSTFYLYDSNQSGPSLKNGGVAFVAGSAGGWTPIGAEQTATGMKLPGKLQDPISTGSG